MLSRPVAALESKLERHLANYAVAAGAVGIGLLSLAQPAPAEVIYTPAHVRIGAGGLTTYILDIDHDGFWDLFLSVHSTYSGAPSPGLIASGIDYGKRIQVTARSYARARKVGGIIGLNRRWDRGNDGHFMARESADGTLFGEWANVKNRYLAVWFSTDKGDNFGWVRFNVHFGPGLTMHATLTGYAYETEPNTPIVAGDEGTRAKSLGHLALGAADKRRAPVAGQ